MFLRVVGVSVGVVRVGAAAAALLLLPLPPFTVATAMAASARSGNRSASREGIWGAAVAAEGAAAEEASDMAE